jgi:hypothetical protein
MSKRHSVTAAPARKESLHAVEDKKEGAGPGAALNRHSLAAPCGGCYESATARARATEGRLNG